MKIKLLLTIIGAIAIASAFVIAGNAKAESPIKSVQNTTQLKRDYGITLSLPTKDPRITRQQAIAIANATPLYARWVHGSFKSTHVEYWDVTDKELVKAGDQELDKTPCYIVTYEGLNNKIGSMTRRQYNIIVNAQSGKAKFGFSYQ